MPNLDDYKHCNWCSTRTDLGLCDPCYAEAQAIIGHQTEEDVDRIIFEDRRAREEG